jgi:hypothetical protein
MRIWPPGWRITAAEPGLKLCRREDPQRWHLFLEGQQIAITAHQCIRLGCKGQIQKHLIVAIAHRVVAGR